MKTYKRIYIKKIIRDSMKYSIHIGINYKNTQYELKGCHNDALNLNAFFINKQYNTLILIDKEGYKQPTKSNILYELNRLCQLLKENDTLVITYSGHGTQVRDLNGDEESGLDQCICPIDMNTKGYIVDDELFSIINKVCSNCSIYCIADCCHSGTIFDLAYNFNSNLNKYIRNNKCKETNKKVCLISGCRDNQTSADAYIESRSCGALTWALLNVLSRNIKQGKQLIDEVNKLLTSKYFTQVSCLSVGNLQSITGDLIDL